MNGKVTDVGGLYELGVLYGATAKPTAFTMQLFTDAATTQDSDINTTHTLAVGGGYADKAMSNNATMALNAAGIPTATWPAQSFAFTGALTGATAIKGYQVLQGTTLLFEELLAQPYTPALNGDTLIITPTYTKGNGTPT